MIVLDSTRPVMEAARLVRIDDAAVRAWAAAIRPRDLDPAGPELLAELPGTRAQIANLVLLIDSLNFCFWGDRPAKMTWRGQTWRGFNAMLAAVVAAAQADPRWSDARYWADVPAAEFRSAFAPCRDLPMLEQRESIVRETGRTLLDRFDGQFVHAVESVNFRAWDLAALLLVSFDSFRDVADYGSQPVFFAKRAQITALDLSQTWAARNYDPLVELERLAAFADYRLPQALRHLGILRLDDALAAAIDNGTELAAGSPGEVELRATTIWAVERMRVALAERGLTIPAWQIDAWLWNHSHDADVTVAHHRTRTIFY